MAKSSTWCKINILTLSKDLLYRHGLCVVAFKFGFHFNIPSISFAHNCADSGCPYSALLAFKMCSSGISPLPFDFHQFRYCWLISTNVCKYYAQLDRVMKNRPNVYPVYTNSSDVDDEEDSIVMSTHSSNLEKLGICGKYRKFNEVSK
jgi:hypothetical protein